MGEEFKTQIEAKIDSAVDKFSDSESYKHQNEGLERFTKKVEQLRRTLKDAVLKDNVLDEDRITDDEWQEVLDSIPSDLLEGLIDQGGRSRGKGDIKDITTLKKFISLELLNRDELLSEVLSWKYGNSSIGYMLIPFYRETLFKLSSDDQNFILLELAKRGFMDRDDPYADVQKLKNLPDLQEILTIHAQKNPLAPIRYYDDIQSFSWARELVTDSFKRMSDSELKQEIEHSRLPQDLTVKAQDILQQKQSDLAVIGKLIEGRRFISEHDFRQWTSELAKDYALYGISQIKPEWLPSFTENPKVSINMQANIARNLYFQGKVINEQNVRAEVKRLQQLREQYHDMPIFNGRNVVLGAHSEMKESDYFGDLHRFGKQALVERIRKDNGNISGVLRPEEGNLESLKQTKVAIIEAVKTTQPPFTFVFQGHGGPDALYLSDGKTNQEAQNQGDKIIETENTVKITVHELFEAYKIRKKKFQSNKSQDIFIDAGCYNSNFIRNFYILCEKEGIQKPIFIGESEYGQYGYSEYISRYGDSFFDGMFDNNDEQRATIGNIMDNDDTNPNSNPSIYIPSDTNQTIQLSENKRDELRMVA